MESGLEIVSESPRGLVLHAPPDVRLGWMILGIGLGAQIVIFLLSWWIVPRARGLLPLLSIPFSLAWLLGGAFFLTGSSTVTFVNNTASVRIEERRLVFRTNEQRSITSITGARVERTLWGGKAIALLPSGELVLAGASDAPGYDEAVLAIGRQLALR
jgi:hypothetical protein